MKIVTREDMAHVDIRPGWLKREFCKRVLGITPSVEADLDDVLGVELSQELRTALREWDALVYQKNQQYKDAWQIDGPITALTDLKDKLYRLDSASESGAVITWNKDKLRGTLFDILVRDIMCLAWFGLNFKDDDDDRQDSR
jgi:hypothetical protein